MRGVAFIVICILPRFAAGAPASAPASRPAGETGLFARENLVAWCIVPFDAKQRSPEERAAMLARLGIKKFAYDWREQHLPMLEREIAALQKHGIELTAFWFPGALNDDARFILATLAKHKLTPQLWVSIAANDVESAVNAIRPIATEAARIGCTVGLYNHGGWFGEPENQIAIIERLAMPNVGIVYNQHHGHDHVGRFETLLARMKPHLLCLNLNGMTAGGAKAGKKILVVGEGELDRSLLKTIKNNGYRGPIGILNHTDLDAEQRLKENLDGLERLVPRLDERAAKTGVDYWAVESAAERAALPMYKVTPAADQHELTPANGPDEAVYASWPRSHGNDANTRFSPLAQITRQNVAQLKVAWTYRSKDGAANVQCNPIAVDGVMYGPTAGDHVVAINAASGEEIWRFKPGQKKPAMRGLTYHEGRLIFAAGDALWALDAKSGKPVQSFGSAGFIRITDCVVAPAVFENVLIYPGWNGDVFGVDFHTGSALWTFRTVPRGGEEFAETWDAPAEGANCWGGMALDASRGIAYVTTGSPKPNFIGVGHHGDNLFSNCVIALDARTGKRLWHFQEVRHDIWDLDIPAPPVLVTVNATRDGRTMRADAVAAVTKLGNTLLLDRVSGKPLFPFRRKRAPRSTLPGERTSAYQPDVEMPQPFARAAFTLDDVTDISAAARRFVLDKLQQSDATFGWFRPFDEGRPNAMYGFHGGAEWTGACFDPTGGLLYVSSNHVPWLPSVHARSGAYGDESNLPKTAGRTVYEKGCMACHGNNREGRFVNPALIGLSERMKESDVVALLKTGRGSMPAATYLTEDDTKSLVNYLYERDRPPGTATTKPRRPAYRDNGYPKLLDHENYPGCKPPWGLLNAIDLNTGKIAWQVRLGEHEELTRRGVPKTGTENFGGPLVTAGGLVFCAGTRDLKIRAFDKSTGNELWSADLPFGGFAPPTTYEVNGKQYVIIAATGGGKLAVEPRPSGPSPAAGDAYVAFALP